MKKVLLAANISESFKNYLSEKGYAFVEYELGEVPTDVDGIITSTKLSLDQDFLKTFTNLKWIGRLGSGVEIIDVAFCKQNNIAFASSPTGIANAVAEHCIAMLISLQKNIAMGFVEVQNKKWIREPNRGWELEGKTIGLVGYGHTGQAFAKKLAAFGVKVIGYDKYKNDFSDEYVTEVGLRELQETSDIISFHVPLNNETKHYYDQYFIATCRKHILINTSRGEIVSTKALLDGLQHRQVLGATLDVLENEKVLIDSKNSLWKDVEKLLSYKVIITPHIAGYSYNAIEKMSAELMEKLREVF